MNKDITLVIGLTSTIVFVYLIMKLHREFRPAAY